MSGSAWIGRKSRREERITPRQLAEFRVTFGALLDERPPATSDATATPGREFSYRSFPCRAACGQAGKSPSPGRSLPTR